MRGKKFKGKGFRRIRGKNNFLSFLSLFLVKDQLNQKFKHMVETPRYDISLTRPLTQKSIGQIRTRDLLSLWFLISCQRSTQQKV